MLTTLRLRAHRPPPAASFRRLAHAQTNTNANNTHTMKRPANWKQAAPAPLAGTPTFAAQHALPRLPVPALDATLEKWKESLAPLAWSAAEHAAAVRKVEAFGAAGGAGRELHARLVRHAQGREHWLEEWWDDGGYLGYRDSVSASLRVGWVGLNVDG